MSTLVDAPRLPALQVARHGRRRWFGKWPWLIPVMALNLAGTVFGLAVLVGGPQTSRAARYPQHWDPRVADLAGFVERSRGLSFEHPVAIEFLTEAEFKKQNTLAETDLTAEDRRQLKKDADFLLALGLIDARGDLLDAENQLESEGTLAYYDSGTQKVTVRGKKLSIGTKVTVVHELTHALQDQHFDLESVDESDGDGALNAYTALVEGDAIRMENAYVAELTDAQFKDLQNEESSQIPDLSNVAAVLDSFYAAPYELGPQLVEIIADTSGNKAVDAAFRKPPVSEEQMLDPFAYLSVDGPKTLAAPTLKAGDKKTDSGEFGAILWYLLLAERLDPHLALAAADGWGADSYTAYRKAGRPCVAANFEGDSPAETGAMAAALRSWVASIKAGGPVAGVEAAGRTVRLDSCAPAHPDAPVRGPDSIDPLQLPAARSEIALSLLQTKAPRSAAHCISREVASALSLEEIDGGVLDAEELPPAVQEKFKNAVAACGR